MYYNVVVLARPQGETAVMPDDHRQNANGRQRQFRGPEVISSRRRHVYDMAGNGRARPRSRNTIGEENMEAFANNLGDMLTPDSKVY